MKKIVSIVLVCAAVLSLAVIFASCGNTEPTLNTDYTVKEMVAAITEKCSYDGLISNFQYKEDDVDELVKWRYGLYSTDAVENMTDYVISLPTDYCQTLAIFKFDDEITEEKIAEVKEIVNKEYLEARASALQMYMPEEYAKTKWALENLDIVWHQYNNVLVLCVYNDEAGTNEAFAALEALFSK